MAKKRKRERGKQASAFQAAPGTLVAFSYELYDADGDLVEASDPRHPVEFVFGYGQASAALEAALAGVPEGQARRVRLSADEAFGARDSRGIIEVDRSELPPSARLGDEFPAETEHGADVLLKVIELSDDVAVLDTNHPLAGQTVELDVVVETVRPATAAELAEAERLLTASGGSPTETLIPLDRLLKRDGQKPPPSGPSVGPPEGSP